MTNDKLILILNMIIAFDDYGNELNFTKEDIDNIVKKHDILNINLKEYLNERAIIVLLNHGYITSDRFSKIFDIEFDDSSLWIVCDNFEDVLNEKCSTAISALNGKIYEWYREEFYDVNISDYWNDYTEETLSEIIKYCIKNKIEIDDKLMTAENTILKNKDIYFNDIQISEIIDDDENLSDLKQELNFAICDAQESANVSLIYDKSKREFESAIGKFKWKDIKISDTKTIQKLYIEINESISSIENFLIDKYDKYEFETEDYGTIIAILKEMNYFENFSEPNYDYLYASIDNDDLNENTQERLLI